MRGLLSVLLICFVSMGAYAAPPPFSVSPYPLTAEDKAVLARVEDYLNSIHTISAEFTQAAPGGDISSGKFYLERPGKLRMEYAPPTPVLMVAKGNDITYYDKELDQISHISMDSTLVGFLSREKMAFDDTVIITGFENAYNSLRITLVQSKRRKDGALTLEFSDKPLTLRNMIVTDSSGQVTSVSLNNARFNMPLDPDLFIFKDPHPGRGSGIQK